MHSFYPVYENLKFTNPDFLLQIFVFIRFSVKLYAKANSHLVSTFALMLSKIIETMVAKCKCKDGSLPILCITIIFP